MSCDLNSSDTPWHQMFRASAVQSPFTFLKNDQIRGSFDGMRVKVKSCDSQLLRLTRFSRRLAVAVPWPDRGGRRPMLTDRSKQMASKV